MAHLMPPAGGLADCESGHGAQSRRADCGKGGTGMLRVGLTGGIGSGKSTVSERLAALGAVVLDADKAARAVVEPGTPGLAQIAAAFGPDVIAPDGSLDRPRLAEIVFADESALAKLNAITHPLIRDHIKAAEEAAIQAGGPDLVLIHDIALLAEWGRSKEFDLVIVVDVPTETQVERLTQQRGMPEDQARARIAAQATRDQRLAIADIIIDNSGTRADLDRRITEVWSDLQARAKP
jgi:dephospho-CoA kinase